MRSIRKNNFNRVWSINQLVLGVMFFLCHTAIAQKLHNPNKEGPLGTQVNTYSGNLFLQRTDLYIPARGFDFDISFNYNSFLFSDDDGYGKGWSFEYNIKYSYDTIPGGRLLKWGNGREDRYDSIAGGGYQSPKGFFTTLSQYQPGRYLLVDKIGTKYYFDNAAHRRITRMEESNGNFIDFGYNDSLLISMVNAAGQAIAFAYNPQGRLASVTDAMVSPARTFTYSYDVNGNLVEVKDPLNGKTQYSYLVNGPMKSLSDKNSNKVDIIYFPGFPIREVVGCNKRLSFAYDTSSHVTVVTDHLETGNQVTKYKYKVVNGRVWLESMSGNCCGFDVSYEYDQQGNKIKSTDANGQVYTYTYDALGNMLTSTDPLGQVSTFTYTPVLNNISSFKDPKGNIYSMNYDAKGNLVKLVTPGNNIYTAEYNSAGDIISGTDPRGNKYTYSYNAWGNPTTIMGPGGYRKDLSFNSRGNLVSITDSKGFTKTAEYDVLDRLKKVTDPANHTTQFGYDAESNIVKFINENGEFSTFNYDASSRLVSIKGPTGNEATFRYDGMNNILSMKDAIGAETKLVYDDKNRLKKISDVEGNNITYDRDGNGNIIKATFSTGRVVNYEYDKVNRLVSIKDDLGVVTRLVYDQNGNCTSMTNSAGAVTTRVYDSLNRIIRITDPLGNVASCTYDRKGNLASLTDREGHTTQFTYDSLNRLKMHTDEAGHTISAVYDASGNITSLTDQNGNTTSYEYDSLNRRKKMIFPDGKHMDYTYDIKSNITAIGLTDGTVVSYQYDTLNRMISRTLPGGEVYSFSYDKLNRVVTAANSNGVVSFTYDIRGRIESETFDGRTVRYKYNVAGRTQTITYPDSSVVTKEFDTRNRLTRILFNNNTIIEYAYNNSNQLISKDFPNGVRSLMQYDYAGRLVSLATMSTGVVLQDTRYTYDKDFNKTVVSRLAPNTPTEQFTYDSRHRLTQFRSNDGSGSPVQNDYVYDPVGNRISVSINGVQKAYSTNMLNQITAVDGVPYVYDDRGNIVYDGGYYKSYDGENRLTRDSSSPQNVIHYGYDALNRRVIKKVNGNVTKFTYSGNMQIEERSAGNSLMNRTVFDRYLSPVMNEKNGSRYYYHNNEQGSIEGITNNGGRLIEKYRYDAYGKFSRLDSLGNSIPFSIAGNRFGFTGQEYDSATGNYQFFYRNYSPVTGSFSQRDPIEYGDGMSLYQYVGNDPANGIDVLGLDAIDDKYDLGPGYSYSVELMYGKDPCYHDAKKVKYISEWEIQRTKETMMDYMNNFPGSDYEAIGSADSRYYTSIARQQLGENEYYFQGQVLQNYEVNYFFTGYAAGTRGYGGAFAQTLSRGWNAAKGGIEAVTFNGVGRLLSTLNPAETRTTMMHAGTIDGRLDAGYNNFRAIDVPIMVNNPTGGVDKGDAYGARYDNKVIPGFGEWWPVINPSTGEMGYEFFPLQKIKSENVMEFRRYMEENCLNEDGTQKIRPGIGGEEEEMHVTKAQDPNEIIGPQGKPTKKWVAVHDRLPYTILFENDSTATARARFIRITAPVQPNQDPTTLELGSVGFNNQSFEIPAGRAFYYQRLDARDSTGVYVDLTAGYDVANHQLFWEFQAIDPITLLAPDDPLAGFLFQHDSLQPAYGNGFVNFSIKPRADAQTLDTIGAKAFIIFDENEVIPTNIYTNTIDAVAPTSQMVSATVLNSTVTLTWSGEDDANGSGVDYYSVYVSTDQVNYSLLFPKVFGTDTSFILAANTDYCFFVLATDRVGQTQEFQPGLLRCASVGGPLPVTWLYFNGTNQDKDNLLQWATGSEQNSREFRLERSLNGTSFSQIAVIPAAGNSSTNRYYNYTDRRIDLLNSDVMYYRIKQVDIDNNFRYSSIVKLNYGQKDRIPTIVYPNPTGGMVTIVIGDKKLLGTDVMVMDVNGRQLQRVKLTAGSQQISLNNYVNGIYFLRLKNNETLKIIKQ